MSHSPKKESVEGPLRYVPRFQTPMKNVQVQRPWLSSVMDPELRIPECGWKETMRLRYWQLARIQSSGLRVLENQGIFYRVGGGVRGSNPEHSAAWEFSRSCRAVVTAAAVAAVAAVVVAGIVAVLTVAVAAIVAVVDIAAVAVIAVVVGVVPASLQIREKMSDRQNPLCRA